MRLYSLEFIRVFCHTDMVDLTH